MQKREINFIMKYYKIIKNAILQELSYVVIKSSRDKTVIVIDKRIKEIIYCIELGIENLNDVLYENIIKAYFFERKPEKYIITNFPISHSTFFRIKDSVQYTIYALLISKGYIEFDAILKEKFFK